jgi:hypothetical protein
MCRFGAMTDVREAFEVRQGTVMILSFFEELLRGHFNLAELTFSNASVTLKDLLASMNREAQENGVGFDLKSS